ncbi:hypothetical protein LP414_27810 [Polaromonas sp. P1(28)-13]|nr:hypothetical protein LP414_27810 [Polaromonas sp. P1(28)-13]
MGVHIEGLFAAEEMLMVLDSTVKKRVVRMLIKKGDQLRKLAIKMAPVDEGNLEKAIKMRPDPGEPGGRERDEAGRFIRTEVEVYIDMDMSIPGRPGETVGTYAYEIHEHLTPMGSKNLGEKSNIKQLGSADVEVGGGFMVRAADKIEEGLDQALQAALEEI